MYQDNVVEEKSPSMPMLDRPNRNEAEDAVRVLIRWANDNPSREGLKDTPKRVVKAYEDYFSGYKVDPVDVLQRTFDEVGGYDEVVMLNGIRFESHCEHHMAPIIGHASVAYLPDKRVVGISKLARVVELYSKRLQIQEKMTAEIAKAITYTLEPKGVAVIIEATHQCISTRGIRKPGVIMQTSSFLGEFNNNESLRREFILAVSKTGKDKQSV